MSDQQTSDDSIKKLAQLLSAAQQSATEKQKEKDANFKDVSLARGGAVITIPDDMSLDRAIEWLKRKKVEEEQVVAVREIVQGHPLDGAHALVLAIKEKYGFAANVPTQTMFGPKPPRMIGIEVGVGETIQVPWGQMQIPGIDGYIQTSLTMRDNDVVFAIGGEVRQKHKADIAALAKRTREIITERSIYRGKAIRITFESDLENYDPQQYAPHFLDLSGVRSDELILSETLGNIVQDALFTPIEKTQRCVELGIPLKRGILLAGPYGTGKTQTAYLAAKKCVENGWTFLYLEKVADLQRAIYFAQQYQPAVIFAEDIDRVTEGGRSQSLDSILNTIDGVSTKNSKVMVALTTNHLEKINKAMLRPGRLDAVVNFSPPDAGAVERLLRLYGRGLIAENERLGQVATKLAGYIPAVVREVVERAKLSAVRRMGDKEQLALQPADLSIAADSMIEQTKLVTTNDTNKPGVVEQFAETLATSFAENLHKASNGATVAKRAS